MTRVCVFIENIIVFLVDLDCVKQLVLYDLSHHSVQDFCGDLLAVLGRLAQLVLGLLVAAISMVDDVTAAPGPDIVIPTLELLRQIFDLS